MTNIPISEQGAGCKHYIGSRLLVPEYCLYSRVEHDRVYFQTPVHKPHTNFLDGFTISAAIATIEGVIAVRSVRAVKFLNKGKAVADITNNTAYNNPSYVAILNQQKSNYPPAMAYWQFICHTIEQAYASERIHFIATEVKSPDI